MHSLEGLHAVLPGILQHHLVEFAAHHLPGLRALVGLVVPEIEGCRLLSVRVDELHAVLLGEAALPHLLEHVELLEHPVGLRDERFADVETRKVSALEQTDAESLLRDEGRDRGTGRPPADDDHVAGWVRHSARRDAPRERTHGPGDRLGAGPCG